MLVNNIRIKDVLFSIFNTNNKRNFFSKSTPSSCQFFYSFNMSINIINDFIFYFYQVKIWDWTKNRKGQVNSVSFPAFILCQFFLDFWIPLQIDQDQNGIIKTEMDTLFCSVTKFCGMGYYRSKLGEDRNGTKMNTLRP